ncbi:MAG: aminopeptidase P family protein [Hyphomicrobiales bacterium]|nr:aminopeptidase P family protein [Hyphomicrobiales bacterium]
MFQTFDDSGSSADAAKRVARLREELAKRDLAGFLVPRADEHQGEYVPANAERLSWLTGFSGSAGFAAILTDSAALFVDGRYTLQAPGQVDTKIFAIQQVPENKPTDWLKETLKKGDRLGYDPKLHTVRSRERLEKAVKDTGATLAPQGDNPVDAIWEDRPPPPLTPVIAHPMEFAGESAADKIARIQDSLKDAKIDAAILTLPDSIAWLLNIRGNDVPHTPLPLSFAILHVADRPELFIAGEKVTDSSKSHIDAVVRIREPGELDARLAALAEATVRLDPDTAAAWFADRLAEAGAKIMHGPDPCILPKAKKNAAEIAGMRNAHARDGAAMCRFLAWLDREAPSGKVDEIAAAEKLEALRAETGELKEISFDTISGAGANGAIVHYRVTRATNAPLEPNSLYLVDSGAQYADGTTDITRTVAIGEPTEEMRRHFTLVLKGHIAIATAKFPKGTRGSDLDPFARRPLWQAGLDFDHGTGHGVGSYLSVHEGPARISKLGTVALEPGMILSNEPGFYREGHYGIRIENLVLVNELASIAGGDREMMGFDTLTLAPIDHRLVAVSALSEPERDWLNAYHAQVLAEIGPALGDDDKGWLKQVTAAI